MSFKRRLDALEQLEAQALVPSGYGTHIYGMDEDGTRVDAVVCLIDGRRAWVSVEAFYSHYPNRVLIETYDPGATL